jgi:hypothetical protein
MNIISKNRVELIIILLFILLFSLIWVWYGEALEGIKQKEELLMP